MKSLAELVAETKTRLVMPIAVFPGLDLVGGTVRDIVTNPDIQFGAAKALHERFRTPVVMSAMDLSVESEAFGCSIALSDNEVPTVTGSLIGDMEQAKKLRVPNTGEGRTGIYLEVVRRLAGLSDGPLVLAGCIGPFSLAARLVGVSEAMTLTLTDPELMHLLLEKCSQFLVSYIKAFQGAGAGGLIMAEPAAGLLSPNAMREFSSNYIHRIISEAGAAEPFSFILHNCAAKLLHLPAILQSGAKNFHFGAPMDIVGALKQVAPGMIVCGNLDPSAVFVQGSSKQVAIAAEQKLAETHGFRNFVLSSGCDVPVGASIANLDAFFAAVKS